MNISRLLLIIVLVYILYNKKKINAYYIIDFYSITFSMYDAD